MAKNEKISSLQCNRKTFVIVGILSLLPLEIHLKVNDAFVKTVVNADKCAFENNRLNRSSPKSGRGG